jgi:hypothetical protein
MTMSAISTAAAVGAYSPSQPQVSQHKHSHFHSMSDIDSQGSSLASAPSSTGKTGSKVDVAA